MKLNIQIDGEWVADDMPVKADFSPVEALLAFVRKAEARGPEGRSGALPRANIRHHPKPYTIVIQVIP